MLYVVVMLQVHELYNFAIAANRRAMDVPDKKNDTVQRICIG